MNSFVFSLSENITHYNQWPYDVAVFCKTSLTHLENWNGALEFYASTQVVQNNTCSVRYKTETGAFDAEYHGGFTQ